MALGALPETLEAMTGQQKALLGLRAWHAVRVSPKVELVGLLVGGKLGALYLHAWLAMPMRMALYRT